MNPQPSNDKTTQLPNYPTTQLLNYIPPAILHELDLETRAGSPLGGLLDLEALEGLLLADMLDE